MTDRIVLLVCSHLQAEVSAAAAAEGLDNLQVMVFPAGCTHQRTGWETLSAALPGNGPGPHQAVILGGACLAYLGEPPPDMLACHLCRLDQCFHMFLDRAVVERLQLEGAYLLTPGWLAAWRRQVEAWGFSRETAREFFNESARRLVLLDTGVDGQSQDHLGEFSRFVRLPFEIMPVGLDLLRLRLSGIVLERRLEEERRRSTVALAEAGRQSAGFAMAFDLIATLGRIATEAEAVESILETFTALFAPSRLVYLPVTGGKPGTPLARPPGHLDPSETTRLAAGFEGDYMPAESGDGFLLRIHSQGETVGILEVGGIAFPEYRDLYLNLALAIGGVCGLAVSNARTYERIKRAEEGLERYRLLSDQVRDIILFVRPDGRIAEANGAAVGAYGYARDELLSLGIHDLRAPDTRPQIAAQMQKADTNGILFETLHQRADGSTFPVEVSSQGAVVGGERVLLSVIRDITERKRAQDALKFLAEASVVLSSSLDYEATLAAVARLSVSFVADCSIVCMIEEDGTVRRLAVAHADPSKKELEASLSRYGAGAPDGPLSQVLRTGRAQLIPEVSDSLVAAIAEDAKHLRLLKEGMIHSLMIVPLPGNDGVLGAIVLASASRGRRYRDADLSLAEDLARRAALAVEKSKLYRQAQAAIHARDEFLSVAAHELKTPITSLRGFAQLTLRRIARDRTPDPEWLQQAMQVIDQQSRKLSVLVSQLLDISRIEAGRLALSPRPTDLSILVADVLETCQANTTEHLLVLEVPPSVLVEVDPVRIEQVVINLVDNAIKYSPNGGRVDVEVRGPQSGLVRILVRDRGIGIPPEQRHRIFDRFYQSEKQYGGMGLGLYISREIVQLHGGSIEVESPPDGGTRFVVSLPAAG